VAVLVILVFSLAPAETLTLTSLDQDERNGWLQEM
jgi:hypothetical protein